MSPLRRLRHVLPAITCLLAFAGCGGSSNELLASGDLGLNLVRIGGNGQNTQVFRPFTAPISVRVLAAGTGEPLAGVPIEFLETSASGASVVPPSLLTDSSGKAEAQVIAGAVSGPIRIQARVAGSPAGIVFDLTAVNSSISGPRYKVTTTVGNTVTAGVPFGFVVRLADENDNTMQINETRTLNWSIASSSSWTGSSPVLPSTLACTFVNGICTTAASFVLTDARAPTRVSVQDSLSQAGTLFPASIAVSAGPASKIVIANRRGGPAGLDGVPSGDDAAISPSTTVFLATDAAQSFSAALTDGSGNYLSDASVTWSGSIPAIQSNLSSLSGLTTVFTPNATGLGNLTASNGIQASATIQLVVNPGAPDHLQVTTQNGGIERYGTEFKVLVTVKDVRNNTVGPKLDTGGGGLSGYYSMKLSTNGGFPGVGQTCSHFYVPAEGESYSTLNCNQKLSSFPLIDGVVVEDVFAVLLNPAVAAPVITVQLTLGAATLSGSVNLSMSIGPPYAIRLWRDATHSSDFTCFLSAAGDRNVSAFSQAVGSTVQYWAFIEDKAGNLIESASATWSGSGTWAGRFSTAGPASTATLNPVVTGDSSVTLSATSSAATGSVSLTTTYYGTTTP